MPTSDEAAWWFNAVYEAVQQIPPGRVTTYKHIAVLLGYPKRARQVGICLKHLPDPRPQTQTQSQPGLLAAAAAAAAEEAQRQPFHSDNVPWQRVINSKGGISPRGDGGTGANRQVARLRAEGVQVLDNRGGGVDQDSHVVDLSRFGWFPDRLPNEPESESDEAGEAET